MMSLNARVFFTLDEGERAAADAAGVTGMPQGLAKGRSGHVVDYDYGQLAKEESHSCMHIFYTVILFLYITRVNNI